MPFFARPNLDDTQFKQLSGSTLTLSGTTRIVTPSGLTLSDGGGGDVVITAKNAGFTTDGYVLTYDYCKNEIGLCLSAASGGTQIYNGASPTTCTVGGLTCNTSISGQTLSCIIQQIVAPALNPVLTPPYIQSFSLSCSPSTPTGYYEIGICLCVSATTCFNRGCVNPAYCGSCDKRSGPPNTYCYTYRCPSNVTGVSSSSLTNTICPTCYNISGNESYTIKVCYDQGYCVYNSCGNPFAAPLSAGTTSISNAYISAVYPYFWGKSVSLPVAGQTIIDNACTLGDVCISISAGDTCVSNYCASGEYIWFAIPATSTSKTKWQGCNSPSNCGIIPGTLFATETCVSISSCGGLWSSVPYKFYISNYATSVNYIMAFKNS
jgi:hypothetical protein